MLLGIDPLLTGDLLAGLDAMGHSDAVCLADAHFPAARLADRIVELPGASTPDLLGAVCSVLPFDDTPALDLMASPDEVLLPVQSALLSSAGVGRDGVRMLGRQEFYDVATGAFLVVRTGETRTYGNAIVRKGVVPANAANRA